MSFASSRRLCTSPQLENFLSLPAPALPIRAGGRQSRRTLYGQEMNEAKDVFTLIDKDGNGFIDFDEVGAARWWVLMRACCSSAT